MFKKAERKKVALKIAMTGPSGSGKTYSALQLAKGLGDKIAVIDTENGSASLYSALADFDVVDVEPPFFVEKYTKAVRAAEAAGYDVLIIDSLSHAWAGDGGLLAQKEQLDSRGKSNSFANWAGITKQYEEFKSVLLQSKIHVIACMRSKTEYALVDQNGKQVPKKMGLAPIMRDGIEYEFTTVFDVAMNHEAEASKDRTGLFMGKLFKITPDTGKLFVEWLAGGKDAPKPPQNEPPRGGDDGGDESHHPENPGEYTIEGGQFAGKSIAQVVERVGMAKAKEYADWLRENKPTSIWAKFYCVNLDRYEAWLSLTSEPDFDPGDFDDGESVLDIAKAAK